jgi:beta-glucanase (GH16 family)/catechol 2,3-dioxygenase-like lactoylglutathione lyase family enzyme
MKRTVLGLLLAAYLPSSLTCQSVSPGPRPEFDHAAVYVRDLQKSADFYDNVVGLERIPDPFHDGRHVWYRIGAHDQLHVVLGATAPAQNDINIHIALRVAAIADFAARLNRMGIPYRRSIRGDGKTASVRPDGVHQIYFQDPDGYWIEVNDNAATATSPASDLSKQWLLTWSDEFNGPNSAPPDATKWESVIGGNGFGNHELEYYTSRSQNVRQENGNLVIEAIREKFTGPDGVARDYTSARLRTQGKFSQQYGRFEARIKIPSGRGIWPAFWLLGDDIGTTHWPGCGEIDIMEAIGSQASKNYGSLHGPGYSGGHGLTSIYNLPHGELSDDFHVYTLEWEPQVVRFYVDGNLYATKTPSDLPAGSRWVYDHPFFVILNLAVGGNFPGNPDDTTVFPQHMLVDYVRVYSHR